MRNVPTIAAMMMLLLMLAGATKAQVENPDPDAMKLGRERLSFDREWRFAFGHPADRAKDFNHATAYFSYLAKAGNGDGPASPDFNDAAWRVLDVPHDWAPELPFDERAQASHGYLAIGRHFPENNIGWYRKTFTVGAEDFGRRISVEFAGVFRDSKVWCNGFYLGNEPSGYAGFAYDITDYLNYGGENVITVRADASMEEGWFYEGAGIYRHVWLVKTAPLHVVRNGTFVHSEVGKTSAKVTAEVTIANDGRSESRFTISHMIMDAEGQVVATKRQKRATLGGHESAEYVAELTVKKPRLWSLEDPYLYKLITEVRVGDVVADRHETTFGIRTIVIDASKGLFLNGKHVVLKGTNNHQDHAGVGVAVPDALNEFRIRRLKEMGSNAYRASHNPPTPELLDACDRLGMLVMDETRLMGSNPEMLDPMKEMILRDRNHPSVFMWSIGNEEWMIEGNVKGTRIARTMQDAVRELDPTRRVTVASSGGWGSGTTADIDVAGFNYYSHGSMDEFHAAFPNTPVIGTEESSKFGTRGIYVNDTARCLLATDDTNFSPWGSSSEGGWRYYADRPWTVGMFVWTGFDYRGEPTPFSWPAVGSQFGILDTCGFPKDHFYYYRSWWQDEPVVHIFPHWNWPDRLGEEITVFCYSNCDEVELLLNGTSLGKKSMERNGHLEWKVKYAPGTLLARGFKGSEEVGSDTVETTGQSAAIRLTADRPVISDDGADVSIITVQVDDAEGRLVPTAMNEVTLSIAGPGRIIGVGNGDPASHEPDQFVDQVTPFVIDGWRVAEVDGLTNRPEVAVDVDDKKWQDPAEWTWRSQGTKNLPKAYVLRGSFEGPEVRPGAVVTMFVRVVGEGQSVYVNGTEVVNGIRKTEGRVELGIDGKLLRKGKNVIAIVASARAEGREKLGGGFASIRYAIPAGPWKRNVFNGLAQVIVQSTGEPGEVVVRAKGKELAEGAVRVKATGSEFYKPKGSKELISP